MLCITLIQATNTADAGQQIATRSTASTPGGQPNSFVDSGMNKELTPEELVAYKAALHEAQYHHKDPIPQAVIDKIASKFHIPPERVRNALATLC